MKLEIGNIITSSFHNTQLMVTTIHKGGCEAKLRTREGGTTQFVMDNEITDVHYLHGDRHSYMLAQDWA